jgi:lipid-A-disaccharide synthase
MVSGSVSLEMLARGKPAIVLYKVPALSYAIVRSLVHVKSITLPNLIAGRRLLPEWCVVLRPERDIRAMAEVLEQWLDQPFQLAQCARDLRQLRDQVVKPGAAGRAADGILTQLMPLGAVAKQAA